MDGDAMSTCDVGLEADSYDVCGQACTTQEVDRPDGLDFFKAFRKEDVHVLRHMNNLV